MSAVAILENDTAILDVEQLRERTFGDDNVMREVVAIFLREYPTWLRSVREAVRDRDARKLRTTAHLISGTGSSCGAGRLAASAQKLERMGKAGTLDGAEAEAEQLYAAASELEPLLRDLL